MSWLGSFFKLVLEILARVFPIKSPAERRRERIQKELKEVEDYKTFLEARLSVAIIKKRSLQVAMLRRELRDVVERLLRLRQEATGNPNP